LAVKGKHIMTSERSPGWKLFFAGIIGLVLIIPLMMVYLLLGDRQEQSNIAQNAIAAGWGGPQVVVGPVLVLPYTASSVETVDEKGRQTTRTIQVKKELFLSPETNAIRTELKPDRKKKSIYESVLFVAANSGKARFALPDDFARYGIPLENIDFAGAELRFGVSDARGLQKDSNVQVNGTTLGLQPGKGLAASNNSGFFSFVDWTGAAPLDVEYSYAIRGNKSLTMVPRGGETTWDVKSTWPSPSFTGDFLPVKRDVKTSGFTSTHAVTNLALGQAIVATDDNAPPLTTEQYGAVTLSSARDVPAVGGPSQAATVGLIEPVDLYSQIDRSVKYGFLFIGFTFLAYRRGPRCGSGVSADRGRARAVLRAFAGLCRGSGFHVGLSHRRGCDNGVVDGLFCCGPEKLAAGAVYWRITGGAVCDALCAAEP
jgi:inner membrane protein